VIVSCAARFRHGGADRQARSQRQTAALTTARTVAGHHVAAPWAVGTPSASSRAAIVAYLQRVVARWLRSVR
jgi:hypothetical protein